MKYAAWRCQHCGAAIGYLGRAFEWLFGTMHRCRPCGVSGMGEQTKAGGER